MWFIKKEIIDWTCFLLDESASGDEVEAFFTGLGGGSADDVADEATGEDDAAFERSEDVSFV